MRYGATLAVLASQSLPRALASLILWDPVVDGTAYLQERPGRAHAMGAARLLTTYVLLFDIPTHDWFRRPLRRLLMDTLTPEAVKASGIFHEGAIEALIRDHMERRINVGYHLWGLLTLFLWMKRWKVELASGDGGRGGAGGRVRTSPPITGATAPRRRAAPTLKERLLAIEPSGATERNSNCDMTQ